MSKKVYDSFVAKYGRLPTEFDKDYLEMLAMSKYIIEPIPKFKPHKCANCGSTKEDGRKYISFGLEVDWYGIVYLCGFCLKDIATEMGLFANLQKDIELAQSRYLDYEELKQRGKDLHEDVNKMFSDLEGYYATLHLAGLERGSDSTSYLVSEESKEESESDGTNVTESDKPVTNPKPRTSKPANVSRPQNVRGLADLLNDAK